MTGAKLHLVSLAHHPDTRDTFPSMFDGNYSMYPVDAEEMIVTLPVADAQEPGDGIIVSRHWAGDIIAVSDTMGNTYTLQKRWFALNVKPCGAGVNTVSLTLRRRSPT